MCVGGGEGRGGGGRRGGEGKTNRAPRYTSHDTGYGSNIVS